jgi:hypothetical protein
MAYVLEQDFMVEVECCFADLKHSLCVFQQFLTSLGAPSVQQEKAMLYGRLEDSLALLGTVLESFQRERERERERERVGDFDYRSICREVWAILEMIKCWHGERSY